MRADLLPCPFCNSRLIKSESLTNRSNGGFYFHPALEEEDGSDRYCPSSGFVVEGNSEDRIAAWNRRAALSVAAEPERAAWRDIKTVPKDGSLVLLGKENDPDWPLRCRRWDAAFGRWRGQDGDEATHWQPLPLFPSVLAASPPNGESREGGR